MQDSIAYHTPPKGGAGWCCQGPTLTACRHEVAAPTAVGERPTIPGPTDRPTSASRFVGAVVTPTNHPRAHPVSASPVTTAPAVIGTHDGVQHPLSVRGEGVGVGVGDAFDEPVES